MSIVPGCPLGRGHVLALALVAGTVSGCSSPLARQSQADLKTMVIESLKRELVSPSGKPETRELTRRFDPAQLEIEERFMPELERMAGPHIYRDRPVPLTPDLFGEERRIVAVTLERAIRTAANNNLEVQFARLGPAVSEAQVVAAEAAFDWTFFNNTQYSNSDRPTPTQSNFLSFAVDQREAIQNTTGLRRRLVSGGQFTVTNDLNYTNVNTPGLRINPSPAMDASISLALEQPLLRGFGSDVALAEVRLARNTERDQVAQLKARLVRTVSETERAYWRLVQAQYDVLIFERLLASGLEVLRQTKERRRIDATGAQVAEAQARVEQRRANLLAAQRALVVASDQLKVLMNDPEWPIGSEVLLLPIDEPLDQSVRYSLLDLMRDAVSNRAEVERAILSIDDTSIRLEVADNFRLPRLDARAQVAFAGLSDNYGEAYTDVFERQFVEYVLGLNFEVPIGNRGPESQYRQRRLERMQATISLRNTLQQVFNELKVALNSLVTDYELIGQRRLARISAAESLRTLLVQKDGPQPYSVEFLAEELRRQDGLAQAERDEVSALIDYNVSLAQLHAATGTALEHNGIMFVVPDAVDPALNRPLDRR